MGCACEDGSRDSFVGVILQVVDKAYLLANLPKAMGKVPDHIYKDILKKVMEAPEEQFSLEVKILGGDMQVSGDMFPQTKEWAIAHIGKPLHFTITQLPRQGGTSMDVHEVEQEG